MADTRTDNLNLYEIGSSSDNVGVHMISHYNFNMNQLDSWIAAHDVSSITIASGTLTITATDSSVFTASVDADDVNYSNSTSGLSATDVQAAIDEIVTAMASKQDTLTEGTGIDITGNTISVDATASEITFDDSHSSLGVSNAQDAIDALNDGLVQNTSLLGSTDISSIDDGTVTGAISSVNSNIATQTVTITYTSSNGTIHTNGIRKVVNAIIGNLIINNITFTANTWVVLGTISSKPVVNYQSSCISNADGSYIGLFSVNTSGEISILPSVSVSNTMVCASFSYCTNG